MHNNVVSAVCSAFLQAGWTCLRFYFRGVGSSGGEYGQGEAEQSDLTAVAGYCREQRPSLLSVAGYSLGAWVAVHAWPGLAALDVLPLILVAPPAAAMSFADASPDAEIGIMVCGDRDGLAPPDRVSAFGSRLNPPLEPVVMNGADHFWSGREKDLTRVLTDYLART